MAADLTFGSPSARIVRHPLIWTAFDGSSHRSLEPRGARGQRKPWGSSAAALASVQTTINLGKPLNPVAPAGDCRTARACANCRRGAKSLIANAQGGLAARALRMWIARGWCESRRPALTVLLLRRAGGRRWTHPLLAPHHAVHHHLLHAHGLIHHVLALPELLRRELGE